MSADSANTKLASLDRPIWRGVPMNAVRLFTIWINESDNDSINRLVAKLGPAAARSAMAGAASIGLVSI